MRETKWVYQKRLTFPPWAFSYSTENHLLTLTLFSEELGTKTNSKTFQGVPFANLDELINIILDIMSKNGISWNSEDVEQIERAVRL